MNHPEHMDELRRCRDRIDELDRQLMRLLNERTKVVERIGQIKQMLTLPIYEPRREDEVFANISRSNAGPLPDAAARRVFERIIDEMRSIQRDRMRGPEKEK